MDAPIDYPLRNLGARELLEACDRSHPEVAALANHLERLLDGLDALKRRLDHHADRGRVAANEAARLRDLPTHCRFVVLPD